MIKRFSKTNTYASYSDIDIDIDIVVSLTAIFWIMILSKPFARCIFYPLRFISYSGISPHVLNL